MNSLFVINGSKKSKSNTYDNKVQIYPSLNHIIWTAVYIDKKLYTCITINQT